ncbi:hypothetical protein TNCT_252371 [Trichonephila clavata]|uniref:Uncharacterized protein n=1 Tax=Trichonephila clavata TaxID=2740835 RepID=A0A8X6LVI9_TRICU|nr:hypothetical protein TNCT_252371 [Trichonephila clavata]
MRLIASNVEKFTRRRNVWHTVQNAEIVMKEITGQKCTELKEINKKNVAARRVNAIEENCGNSETIYIGELKSVNELDTKETNCVWYEKVLVNKNPVIFKLWILDIK